MPCSQVDPNCIECQNLTNGGDPTAYSNQGFNCLQCSPGYVLNNSICELTTPPPPTPTNQTCGYGILEGTEQCDDGNSLNSHGCSLLCIVEVNFICTNIYNNISQLTSKCLYTGTIYLNIIDIQKSDSANQINILIDIRTKRYAFVGHSRFGKDGCLVKYDKFWILLSCAELRWDLYYCSPL